MYSDEIQQVAEEKKEQEFELHPLSKWKRILLFLSDYFLSFIFAFVILNVAISPIVGAISNANKRGEEIRDAEYSRQNILYGNSLLFYETNDKKYDYNTSLEYTCDRWLSYYVLDEMINNYGPNIENEVVFHYFQDIRSNKATYIDNFSKLNTKKNYFDYNEADGRFTMKEEIKDELKLHFVYENEGLSKLGREYLDNTASLFTSLFRTVLEDINENDLVLNGISYTKTVQNYQNLVVIDHWLMTLSLIISHLLAWAIYFIIIPLTNSTGRTISMMIFKAERVDSKHLSLLKKGDVALTGAYHFFINMGYLFLLPLTYSSSGFMYVISLPLIPYMFILSFLLVLISFVIILAHPFNRSLSDLTSRSVIVDRQGLDDILRYKGYYIK